MEQDNTKKRSYGNSKNEFSKSDIQMNSCLTNLQIYEYLFYLLMFVYCWMKNECVCVFEADVVFTKFRENYA